MSREGEILVEPHNDLASLGSAVHEALASVVQSGEVPELSSIALKFAADPDELGMLVAFGVQAWKSFGASFPNPTVEQESSETSLSLSGHMDVLSFTPEVAALVDWKSGYKRSDYYHQVMGYAYLVFANSEVNTMRCSLVWLRDHEVDTITVTREDVEAWKASFETEILHWDGTFHPGEHCLYCPRFTTCPARQALVRSAVIETGDDVLYAQLSADDTTAIMPKIVSLYKTGKLALAKQVIERIDGVIRAHLTSKGPIPLGDGTEMALVPEDRDTIDPLLGWPILTGYLDEKELSGCVKIGKTALLDTVSEKAPKGQKSKVKAQLMTDLKDANAVTTKPIYKMRVRKIQKEVGA